MAPVIKIVGGELGQRASELLVDAAAGYGALADDTAVGNQVINPAAEMFEMRRVTVGSGAVEIQRNIIAKRVLGLPVDARATVSDACTFVAPRRRVKGN